MRAAGLLAATLICSLAAASGHAEEPMDLTPPGAAPFNPVAPKPAKPKKPPVKSVKPAPPAVPPAPAPPASATAAPAAPPTASGSPTLAPAPPAPGVLTQPAIWCGCAARDLALGDRFRCRRPGPRHRPPAGRPSARPRLWRVPARALPDRVPDRHRAGIQGRRGRPDADRPDLRGRLRRAAELQGGARLVSPRRRQGRPPGTIRPRHDVSPGPGRRRRRRSGHPPPPEGRRSGPGRRRLPALARLPRRQDPPVRPQPCRRASHQGGGRGQCGRAIRAWRALRRRQRRAARRSARGTLVRRGGQRRQHFRRDRVCDPPFQRQREFPRTRPLPRAGSSAPRKPETPSRRTVSRGFWRPGSACPPTRVAAAKWHFLARSAGKDDAWLDSFVDNLTDVQRQSAAAAAQRFPGN